MENNTASTPNPNARIVTGAYECLSVDGHTLLTANAGVPVELALEQAGIMVNCIQHLVLSRDSLEEQTHTTCLQYLTDTVRALINGSHEGVCNYEKRLAG